MKTGLGTLLDPTKLGLEVATLNNCHIPAMEAEQSTVPLEEEDGVVGFPDFFWQPTRSTPTKMNNKIIFRPIFPPPTAIYSTLRTWGDQTRRSWSHRVFRPS